MLIERREAIGWMDYARRRCLSFGTNSEAGRGGWRGERSGLRRSRGVAWSFVKGVDTARGEGEGRGWRRRYKASSLIHTSAPLVSSLISGTESWRTLSSRLSHNFERFGGELFEWVNETLGSFFSPPPLPSFNRRESFSRRIVNFRSKVVGDEKNWQNGESILKLTFVRDEKSS